MAAGTQRNRLVAAVARLSQELGRESAAQAPGAAPGRREFDGDRHDGAAFQGLLSEGDELLVRELSEGLAELASASSATAVIEPPPSAIAGALGGAELLMRSEIVGGRGEQLEALLPGFAYMVTLPYLGQAEALRLSQRTEELLGGDERAAGR